MVNEEWNEAYLESLELQIGRHWSRYHRPAEWLGASSSMDLLAWAWLSKVRLAGNRLNSLSRRNFFRNKFSIPFTSVKQAQDTKFERNLGVMSVVLCVLKNFSFNVAFLLTVALFDGAMPYQRHVRVCAKTLSDCRQIPCTRSNSKIPWCGKKAMVWICNHGYQLAIECFFCCRVCPLYHGNCFDVSASFFERSKPVVVGREPTT